MKLRIGCALAAFLAIFGFFSLVCYSDRLSMESTRRTATLSNVKQCATATLMYAADFDDRLPNAYRWMTSTMPYTHNSHLYDDVRDPSFPALRPDQPDIPEARRHGIAFFSPLSEFDLKTMNAPDKQTMLFTSIHTGWNAAAGLNTAHSYPPNENGNFIASAADSATKYFRLGAKNLDMKSGIWK